MVALYSSNKKNDKVHVCVDFRNLNLATTNNECAMLVVDILVDYVANYGIVTFKEDYLGYNQIFITKEDANKTTFRCLSSIGIFEWVVMPFELKNVRAIYQRAMNMIFS